MTRVFYGWWIAAASSLALSFSIGTLAIYSFSLFVKPLTQEFGWNRGEVSLAITFTHCLVGLSSPVLGRVADRWGSRAVMLAGHLGLGMVLISMLWFAAPLWHLYAVFACVGLLGAGSTPLPYARLVAKWFDVRRGIALGMTMAGVGAGSFIIPPAAQWLIAQYGWRMAYLAMGLSAVVIPVPLILLVLREHPKKHNAGLEPSNLPGATRAEALKTRAFWQMALVFAGASASAYAAVAHLAPILTDRGLPPSQAAFAISLFGISAMVGRLGAGLLMDRFFAPYVAALLFTGVAVGLSLLMAGAGYPAAILIGLGLGAEVDVMPYLVSRYFGLRSLGEIYGLIFASFTFGMATGPYLMGAGFDATRSYTQPLSALIAVMAVTIVGALTLPRFPAKI